MKKYFDMFKGGQVKKATNAVRIAQKIAKHLTTKTKK